MGRKLIRKNGGGAQKFEGECEGERLRR